MSLFRKPLSAQISCTAPIESGVYPHLRVVNRYVLLLYARNALYQEVHGVRLER